MKKYIMMCMATIALFVWTASATPPTPAKKAVQTTNSDNITFGDQITTGTDIGQYNQAVYQDIAGAGISEKFSTAIITSGTYMINTAGTTDTSPDGFMKKANNTFNASDQILTEDANTDTGSNTNNTGEVDKSATDIGQRCK